MKPWLLLLCLTLPCAGAAQIFGRSAFHAAILSSGGDPCSNCTNETFEGTGTVVAGWKYGDGTSGVVTNVDYTTSPAPLNGAQSLLIRNPDSQTGYLQLTVPSSGEVWMRATLLFTNAVVNNLRVWCVTDNVGVIQAEVRMISGAARIICGSANATTAGTLSPNTPYNFWFHYLKGTGANAVADVAVSSTKIKPTSGSGFAQTTTGTATANVQDVFMIVNDPTFGGGIGGVIYDDFSFTQLAPIGDFP
jgi:hypothetical protein